MKSIDYSRLRFDSFQDKPLTASTSTKLIPHEQDCSDLKHKKTQLLLPTPQLEQELKHYEWRIKTEFPIVKIHQCYVLRQEQQNCLLEIAHETHPFRLADLKDLPLIKVLYLIKEVLIGYERLFDRLGPFQVTARMIAMNQFGKCKVWVNQNFALNAAVPSAIQQKDFLQHVFKLFEERSNRMRNTLIFFQQLSICPTFCESLNFIQIYAKKNKISMPSCCKFTQKELIITHTEPTEEDLTKTIKFINNNMRSSLKKPEPINTLMLNSLHSANVQQSTYLKDSNNSNFSCLKMKTSGDTTADLATSKTISYKKGRTTMDFFFNSTDIKEIAIKSKTSLKFSTEKDVELLRKLSTPSDNFCLTPTYVRKDWNEGQHPVARSKLDEPTHCIITESQETDPMTSLFTKNNWGKTLNGLFASEDEMKKSEHHGKQRRAESTADLQILSKFGKDIRESIIADLHEQEQNNSDQH